MKNWTLLLLIVLVIAGTLWLAMRPGEDASNVALGERSVRNAELVLERGSRYETVRLEGKLITTATLSYLEGVEGHLRRVTKAAPRPE